MALEPGALIAGIAPLVILRRMLCPLRFQRLATWATVKKSFIHFQERCQSSRHILIHQNRPGWCLLVTIITR